MLKKKINKINKSYIYTETNKKDYLITTYFRIIDYNTKFDFLSLLETYTIENFQNLGLPLITNSNDITNSNVDNNTQQNSNLNLETTLRERVKKTLEQIEKETKISERLEVYRDLSNFENFLSNTIDKYKLIRNLVISHIKDSGNLEEIKEVLMSITSSRKFVLKS